LSKNYVCNQAAAEIVRRQQRLKAKAEKKKLKKWEMREYMTLSESQQRVFDKLTFAHKKRYQELSYAEQDILWELKMPAINAFLLDLDNTTRHVLSSALLLDMDACCHLGFDDMIILRNLIQRHIEEYSDNSIEDSNTSAHPSPHDVVQWVHRILGTTNCSHDSTTGRTVMGMRICFKGGQ
jgi:hypothetical protein